jgi:hypothetical protein
MKPKTTEKRSTKKRSPSASEQGLSLSPACLEAFSLFKAQIKEPDDSEAFIALIENSQIERLFDATSPQDFFRGSQEEVEPLTELELVRRGAELLHIPLEQLVRSGAISLAKREILTRKHLGSEGESDTPRSGVAGSADHRIQQAFEFLQQASKEITPARLAKLSRTNFNSAQRWIGLNHPQLLLNQKLRPRQARPMREKPAASQQQASPPPSPPPPQQAPAPDPLPEPGKKKTTLAATAAAATAPEPESQPIALKDLALSPSQTIELAYGAVNQRGSPFFSVEPFGEAARKEALSAHQLDPASFGHIELIYFKGHHLVPVVWLMLLLPEHKAFLEKIDRDIYRAFRKPKKGAR